MAMLIDLSQYLVIAQTVDLSCLRDNVTNRVEAARSVAIQRKRFIGGC